MAKSQRLEQLRLIKPLKLGAGTFESHRLVTGKIFSEDYPESSADIFDIQVDRSGCHGTLQGHGVAYGELAFDFDRRELFLQLSRNDLCENQLLGRVLRTNRNHRLLGPAGA